MKGNDIMNKIHDQPKWYHKENWEKLTLIFLSLVGYLEFAGLTVYAVLIESDLKKLIINLYFVLIILAITGLLLRKGMKYSISAKGVSIGYDAGTCSGTAPRNSKPAATIPQPDPASEAPADAPNIFPSSDLRGED